MSDDPKKIGKPDRDRINVNEPHELRDWAKHFYVSQDKIKEAVKAVGVMAKDIERYLSST